MYPQIDVRDKSYEIVDEVGDVNVGYSEGKLKSDNRPYRAEYWITKGVEMMTVFISVVDLEDKTHDEIYCYLEENGVFETTDNPFNAKVVVHTDCQQNKFYSVNIVMGNENTVLVKTSLRFKEFE